MSGPVEIVRIGRLEIFEVRYDGRNIGTINAHRGKPHAIDARSRVHYAETIDACAAWLVGALVAPAFTGAL